MARSVEIDVNYVELSALWPDVCTDHGYDLRDVIPPHGLRGQWTSALNQEITFVAYNLPIDCNYHHSRSP